MTNLKNLPMRILFAAGIGALALLWSGDFQSGESSLFSTAEARVGRPLTPMSYAGVARRTTRRAATYGAAAYGTYGAAVSSCYQAVNSYGQLTTICP